MLVVCHLIFAVSIVGVLLGGTGGWLAAWLVLAGVGNGAGALNMYAIAQMFAGPRASGTWVGVQNGFGNVSGIVQPIVAGVIIDWSGSYAGAFWLAAASEHVRRAVVGVRPAGDCADRAGLMESAHDGRALVPARIVPNPARSADPLICASLLTSGVRKSVPSVRIVNTS